jgi:Holliday junction DNA helicase RuvA
MIGRLAGHVVDEEATGTVLLDVGGVGYELLCPVGTIGRAKKGDSQNGQEVIVYVHTNLRQDALELFGFCSLEERTAFRQLTSVPGVGPRLAISVLNVLPAAELAIVIEAEDKAKMVKIPGVGKKTAERLVLELRGKLSLLPSAVTGVGAKERASAIQLNMRLINALTGLGYRAAEAERAAKAIEGAEADEDLSGLLRRALDFLAS